MSLIAEDLLPSIAEAKKKKVLEKIQQLQVRESDARVMEALRGDSNWMHYADIILGQRGTKEKELQYKRMAMEGNEFLTPKQYGQLKIEIASLQNYIAALDFAIEITTELIAGGEKAKEQIEKLTTG
mgnify:CR=1 FL=1